MSQLIPPPKKCSLLSVADLPGDPGKEHRRHGMGATFRDSLRVGLLDRERIPEARRGIPEG